MTSKEEQKEKATPTVTQVPPAGEGENQKGPSPEAQAGAREMIEARLAEFQRKRDELKKMLGEGFKLTTWKGLDIDVPAIKGKVEKRAIQIILDLFIKNPKLIRPMMSKVERGAVTPADVLNLILESISSAYDSLQHLAAILLNKDVKWVDDNLMTADLLAVARPFLTAEVEGIMEEAKKMRNPMGAMKVLARQAGSASNSD